MYNHLASLEKGTLLALDFQYTNTGQNAPIQRVTSTLTIKFSHIVSFFIYEKNHRRRHRLNKLLFICTLLMIQCQKPISV